MNKFEQYNKKENENKRTLIEQKDKIQTISDMKDEKRHSNNNLTM